MPHRFRRWLAPCLLLAATGPAAAATDGVRLLEAVPGSIRFEVASPEPRLVPMGSGGGALSRVEMEGFETAASPGEAELPVRVVTVAVPPTGEVRVRATASDEAVRDGVELEGAVWAPRDEPAALEATGPAGPAGADRARLIEVSWLRDQRVARVAIYPVQYAAQSRRLSTYGRIDVQVDVAAGAAPPPPPSAARPAEDPFESVYREALVNYEQGRAWRRGHGVPARPISRLSSRVDGQAITVVPDTSVFVGRHWVKIAVPRTGFYRVSFSQFRRFAPFNDDTTTNLDSLRLITWGGGPVLPERDFCDTCGFREVALGTIDDGDNKLDHNSDGIYFYGLGAVDWANHFDGAQPDTVFINDPYETRGFYYLGVSTAAQPFGGIRRRITTRDGSVHVDGDEIVPATFPGRVHQELDVQYIPDIYPGNSTYAWDKFLWAKLAELASFSGTSDATGADTTQSVRLRARLWSLFRPGCPDQRQFVDLTFNNTPSGRFGWRGFNGYTIDTTLSGLKRRGNAVRITAADLRCDNFLAVSWFDLFYPRRFEPVNDVLEFQPPPGGGPMLYRLRPFVRVSRPRLFDLTDPFSPVEIQSFDYVDSAGAYTLRFESLDDGRQRYQALPDTAIATVASTDVAAAAGTSLDNLRSRTQQADYLVIYYDEHQVAADSLAAWRRAYSGFRTKTVPVSAIFDQFSGGRTDPTAIRNFLRAAYDHWSLVPTYVTLLGDASYDFKNLTGRALPGQPGAPLPTYENGFESASQRQYTTDDWLLNVDDPDTVIPDFLGGRLPVPDAATALDVVRNKVLAYERQAPSGMNRNQVMLVADDNEQGSRDDLLHWAHLAQTTQLDTSYTPYNFDRKYVYLHTYADGPGDTKPGAKNAIITTLNGSGVALFNYVGHGSPFKLADESVFLDTDVGALTNADRLPVFIAASCDVGRFSDPAFPSLGERLILRSGGGAVGVVSATDLAYSGQNAALNRVLFGELFERDAAGKFSGEVARALAVGKLGSVNSQKYQLMGDAVTRVDLPSEWIDLELKDEASRDTTAIEQGRRMTFIGHVLDRPGGVPVAFTGTADVLIEDSAPLVLSPPCTLPGVTCDPVYYLYQAGPIYRGKATVTGGTFQGEFVVPLEARPGTRGRVRAYLIGSRPGASATDAVGDIRVRVATGTAPPGDAEGPTIRLSFPNGATRVAPDATLRIDLSDASGILITGHTPQNGIVVTIDGNTTSRVDVTDSFAYSAGSYTSGSASFRLPGLPEGFHRVSVSAADNLAAGLSAGQHRSREELEFEVVPFLPLQLLSAYLFPNPTASKGGFSGGRFVVDTEGGPVDVLLRIYTVSGRLIRTLESFGGQGQVQMAWDGLDAEGVGLANGVYLFKVHVNDSAGSASGSGSQKADLTGRFVILNP